MCQKKTEVKYKEWEYLPKIYRSYNQFEVYRLVSDINLKKKKSRLQQGSLWGFQVPSWSEKTAEMQNSSFHKVTLCNKKHVQSSNH